MTLRLCRTIHTYNAVLNSKCVKPTILQNVKESFTVSMDRASLNSYEGFSDDFQTLNAMQGPFTFACFYDLEPGK